MNEPTDGGCLCSAGRNKGRGENTGVGQEDKKTPSS